MRYLTLPQQVEKNRVEMITALAAINAALSTINGKANLNGGNTFNGDQAINGILSMEGEKIINVADGESDFDVANIRQLVLKADQTDLLTLQSAVVNLQNAVSALVGAYVYRGRIDETNPTQSELTERLIEIMTRNPIIGDVLIDSDNNEWYFSDTDTWENLGQFLISPASDLNLGLVKGDGTYLSIINGEIENKLSKKTLAIKDSASSAEYTYSDLKTKFDNLSNVNNTADADKYVKGLIETRDDVNTKIWTGNQEAYDDIVTKDGNTLYFIVE